MVTLKSTMARGYINLLGELDLMLDRLQDNTGVLPPKTAHGIIPQNWEPPDR